MITITKLRYALAVREMKHFGRASEQCHVTQPTLSIGVSSLENLIGFKLFVRSGKGVSQKFDGETQQGSAFLDAATMVVADFDDLIRSGK